MIGLAMMLAAVPAPSATYVNVRYGFSACYPPQLLRPQPEADNGDGRHFLSRDGADLATYGSLDVDGKGVAGELAYFKEDIEKERGTISYRANGRNWAVISGTSKGRIFYVKVVQRGDQILTFDMTYPTVRASIYNAVTASMSKCFRIGTAAY